MIKKGIAILLLGCLLFTGCTGREDVIDSQREKITEEYNKLADANQPRSKYQFKKAMVVEKTSGEAKYISEQKLEECLQKCRGRYYYEALETEEQLVYSEMYYAITNREKVYLTTVDASVLDKLYQCVLSDHPEIFYNEGYVTIKQGTNNSILGLSFVGQYPIEEAEQQKRQQEMDKVIKECLAGVDAQWDEYTKVKYVYEYLIRHTTYDLNSLDNQNIYSVFANGTSVCQGYAKATQYLLNELGIECSLVAGKAKGSSHAWNLVKVDGEYYYLDTTWGDVDYQEVEGEEEISTVNYEYFLINTKQLELTHEIDTVVPMPYCVSMDANYYVREGLYFTALDKQQLQNCFLNAKNIGANTVTFKAADEAVFAELEDYLLEKQHVFEIMDVREKISYYKDQDSGIFCFWLP